MGPFGYRISPDIWRYWRNPIFRYGRAASGGALAPEPQRIFKPRSRCAPQESDQSLYGSSIQIFGLFLNILPIGRLPRVFFEKSEIGQLSDNYVRSQKIQFFSGFWAGKGWRRAHRYQNCKQNPCPISGGKKIGIESLGKMTKNCQKNHKRSKLTKNKTEWDWHKKTVKMRDTEG